MLSIVITSGLSSSTADCLQITWMVHLPPTVIRVASTLRMQGWNANFEFVVSVSERACSCEVWEMKATVAAITPTSHTRSWRAEGTRFR